MKDAFYTWEAGGELSVPSIIPDIGFLMSGVIYKTSTNGRSHEDEKSFFVLMFVPFETNLWQTRRIVMKEILLQRGQVYFAHLGVALGSEQGGTRPVLVVQNNKGNCHSPTVVVVPITSQVKTPLPTHVKLNKVSRLVPTSCALVEQIRTIDRGRLSTYLGKAPPITMMKINTALKISMGLDPEYN